MMRPIDRGPIPIDGAGNPKKFDPYSNARDDLFTRIGRYCSFCERPIKANLAVEHIHHKAKYEHRRCDWTNFVLACSNCNSTKGIKEVTKRLLFPDRDNTFRGLEYLVGGTIVPQAALLPHQKAKATQLIRLVGLDKRPGHDPKASDLRWQDRREVWNKAERYLQKYKIKLIDVETIVSLCESYGHWSIWMTVFLGIVEVRLALIDAFPGTAACFDTNGNPIQRSMGQL